MGDFNIINVVTLLSGLVTIAGGVVTTVRFVQERRPSSQTPALPSVQQSIPVPSAPQSATPAQAAPGDARSNAPPSPYIPSPYQPTPSVPHYPPAANVPYQPYPGAIPEPSTVSGVQPQGISKRPTSLWVIAIGGIVTQVLWIVVMILVGRPNYAWKYDPTIGAWYTATVFPALILNIVFLIYAAVKAIQLRRWGWLAELIGGTVVGLIFFSGIAIIIFGLFVPDHRRNKPEIP
jgi:hypothetical protein